MEIAHAVKDNILIITFEANRLDAKATTRFKKNVVSLINETGKYHVVFDLGNLNFIDSSGVGVFLSILRFLNSKGGELKLSELTPPVRTILELVSMHKIFEIFKTTNEAVESFIPHTPTAK